MSKNKKANVPKGATATAVTKYECLTCKKEVTDSHLALECEICEEWFHIDCEQVAAEEYTFLSEHKSVHWYCIACNKSVVNVIKLVSNLKLKVEKLDEQIGLICDGKLTNKISDVIEIK